MKVKCPICEAPQGPLVNELIAHIKREHGLKVECYEVYTSNIKIQGRPPVTLDFVKGGKP